MLRCTAAALLAVAGSVHATGPAVQTELFASDDADDTSVLKLMVGADWRYTDIDHYHGLRIETVRIRPNGGRTWRDERLYYAFAGGAPEGWTWKGRVGTDGETALGSASLVREAPVRQEYFVERDILETGRGVDGLYYTFAGAAYDLPLDADGHHQLTALAGVQTFTGENVRTHLRARYIAVVRPDWGLSLQLRARAFRNSEPFEYDYYSPEWFAEAMPVVQLRRFHQRWMYSMALGWGRQRDSGSAWRDARLVETSVRSPQNGRRPYVRAVATYANTPIGSGASYGYRQLTLQWIIPL